MSHQVPWKAFIPVLLARVSSAAVSGYVYPFLPFMIRDWGYNPRDVSFYASLVDSLIIAVEASIAMPCARLSDKYGRRPLLIFSHLWICAFSTLLGFSQNLPTLMMIRILCGINGTRGLSRTITSELSNERTRLKMFSIFVPCFAVGMSIGTFVGGKLSQPEGRIGLGDIWLFQHFPYLLPCVVTGMLPLSAAIIGFLYLRETRPRVFETAVKDTSKVMQCLRHDTIRRLQIGFFVFQAIEFSHVSALMLAAATSVADGGLGIGLSTIGTILGCQAVAMAIFLPIGMRRAVERFGHHRALVILMAAWPLSAMAFPVVISLAETSLLYPGVAVLVMLRLIGGMGWPINDMLLAAEATPDLLSTANACAAISGSAGSGIGPAIFGVIYGLSTSAAPGSLGRFSVWIVMIIAAFAPVLAALGLERRRKRKNEVETEDAAALLGDDEVHER